jgi:hypothetical protein
MVVIKTWLELNHQIRVRSSFLCRNVLIVSV